LFPKQQGRKKEIVSMLAVPDQDEDPNHYRDAIVAEDADDWKIAIDKEYNSLIENKTWELITPPPGQSVIKSRWTFKIKPATRTWEKIFMVRFVAKGFSQVPGVDYNQDEVYALVIKHDSLRTLLALTAKLDLFFHTLDVKPAFLYGDLKEYLLVEQPEGFVQPGTEQLVCHLLRPLYGLVQSPRNWKDKFNYFLEKFGLTRSTAGLPLYPCLY
jgi:hypothetical protein